MPQKLTLPQARALVDAALAITGDPPTTGQETSQYASHTMTFNAGEIRGNRAFVAAFGCTPQKASRVPDTQHPGKVVFINPNRGNGPAAKVTP